jgi:DNA-dependent RNA polymerase auxiliary subunit epsilon
MEIMIKNTNIFDLNVLIEIEDFLKKNPSEVSLAYNIKVVFHQDTLTENSIKKYYETYLIETDLKKDVHDVLKNILYNITERFREYKYNIEFTTIIGDKLELESDNIVRIEIENKPRILSKMSKKFWGSQIIIPKKPHFIEKQIKVMEMEDAAYTLKYFLDKGLISSSEYKKSINKLETYESI